jgi:hypothetical protein
MRAWTAALLLLLASSATLAQAPADEPAGEPAAETGAADPEPAAATPPTEPNGVLQHVRVALFVINVGKLDFGAGTYTTEFYLDLTCVDEAAWCPDVFELESGNVTSKEVVLEEPFHHVTRVKADMTADFDLGDFPLDRQKLVIAMSYPLASTKDLVYVVDPEGTGVDASVQLAGFEDFDYEDRVVVDRDEGLDADLSVYTFEMGVHRVRLAAIMKSFLPPIFIVLVASLGLLLRVKSVTNRLGMGTAGLLSAVMFHISATSSLPPLGYLTLVDKLMIGTYLILVCNILSSVLMIVREDGGDPAGAESVYRRARVIVPVLAVTVYVLVLARIV